MQMTDDIVAELGALAPDVLSVIAGRRPCATKTSARTLPESPASSASITWQRAAFAALKIG